MCPLAVYTLYRVHLKNTISAERRSPARDQLYNITGLGPPGPHLYFGPVRQVSRSFQTSRSDLDLVFFILAQHQNYHPRFVIYNQHARGPRAVAGKRACRPYFQSARKFTKSCVLQTVCLNPNVTHNVLPKASVPLSIVCPRTKKGSTPSLSQVGIRIRTIRRVLSRSAARDNSSHHSATHFQCRPHLRQAHHRFSRCPHHRGCRGLC